MALKKNGRIRFAHVMLVFLTASTVWWFCLLKWERLTFTRPCNWDHLPHIIVYPKAVTATPSPPTSAPPHPTLPLPKCHSGHQDHPGIWDRFRLPSNDVQRETTECEGVWQTQEAGMCRTSPFSAHWVNHPSLSLMYSLRPLSLSET